MKASAKRIWSAAQVADLRLRHSEGRVSPREIAAQWRVGVETVRRMLRGETYAAVERPPNENEVAAELAASAAALAALPTQAAPEKGEDPLARFMREAKAAKAADPDQLVKEIFK